MRVLSLSVLVAAVAVAGCAKKSYVQKEVGEVNKKVDAVSGEVEKTQQRVQKTGIPQIDLGTLGQAFADVPAPRCQPADEVGAFQEVEIAIDSVIAQAEALPDGGSVPLLALHGRKHVQQPVGHLRASGQSPRGQVALRH